MTTTRRKSRKKESEGMKLTQIAEALGVTRQRAHQITEERGWSPVVEGRRGQGTGSLYPRDAVIALLEEQIGTAEKRVMELRERLEHVKSQA